MYQFRGILKCRETTTETWYAKNVLIKTFNGITIHRGFYPIVEFVNGTKKVITPGVRLL